MIYFLFFFFSSRRRHTRCYRDWSSDVCSSDLRGAPVAVGTGPPEWGDRGDHEARVPGAQRRGAATERGQRAGRLALDQHVGPRGEPPERRRATRRPPVERDAALAGAVEPEEEASLQVRSALPEGWDAAERA